MRVKRLSTLLLLVVVVLSGCLAPLTPVPPGLPALPALATVPATPVAPKASPAAGAGTTVAPTAGPSGTAPMEQPVVFPPGSASVTMQGRLDAGGSDLYRLNGQAGQTMSVHLDAPGGRLAFGVMGVNGTMLAEYTGAPDWSGVLTATQVYLVDVHNFGASQTAYDVRIGLTPQPTPVPTLTQPTAAPTQTQPTLAPTEAPATAAPTQAQPTLAPTEAPPTAAPTEAPATEAPTQAPPTEAPATAAPTQAPPTEAPTQVPPIRTPIQAQPTLAPTQAPPTPAPTRAQPAPAPTQAQAVPAPAPTPRVSRITFAPGATSATVQGQVPRGGIDRWVVKGSAGQSMSVKQNGSQLVLAIWGADGTVLLSQMAGATNWSGVLPATQDYNIDVIGPRSGAATYSLTVTMPAVRPPSPTATAPAVSPPSPTATVPPSSLPGPTANRISLAPGAISATVSGTAGPGTDHWVIEAGAGQTMIAQLTPAGGQAILAIRGADGTVLISSSAGATSWSGVLPATQAYLIDVLPGSAASTPYALTVTIPPG